jgi:hypothetical protein
VVVLTPEQRRAVDDALAGYLANYEAAWRAGQVGDYYLFPGSKMRMLDASGRRWTRKVRPNAKPLSREGARVLSRSSRRSRASSTSRAAVGTASAGSRRTSPNPPRPTTASRIDWAGGRIPKHASRSTRTVRPTNFAPRPRRCAARSDSVPAARATGPSRWSTSTGFSRRPRPHSRRGWRQYLAHEGVGERVRN